MFNIILNSVFKCSIYLDYLVLGGKLAVSVRFFLSCKHNMHHVPIILCSFVTNNIIIAEMLI